jgi:2-methylcitrate dehydratase PrpD
MGTPTKPVHAGQAAQNGLKAARLASSGIHGDREIFSGQGSFGDVFSSPHDHEKLLSELGQKYEVVNNGFKLYPCCASAHAAIDAVLQLKEEHRLTPEAVESIRVGTVPLGLDNLAYNKPRDTSECRFSMPFCVALALADGRVDLENFSDERLTDDRMKRLMPKVTAYVDPEMSNLGYRGTGNANVTITTTKGQVFQKQVDAAKGRPSNPLSDDELRNKFMACANRALPTERAEKTLSLLVSFDQLAEVKELLASTSGIHF